MTIDEIAVLERQWIGRVQVPSRDIYFDWQPIAVDIFTKLLELCLPFVPPSNRTFIDAGGGIGTKGLLAQQYGLAAHCIDRVPEYVAEAARLGVSAELVQIEEYGRFGDYGLVYVSHPLVPGPGEAVLERGIHDQVTSGSVLMAVSYNLVPAGWTEIARLGEWNAGWVKP